MLSGKFGGEKVVTIEPMIRIEFSKYGCFAHRYWSSGREEEMKVEDAMREFDRLASSGAFDR